MPFKAGDFTGPETIADTVVPLDPAKLMPTTGEFAGKRCQKVDISIESYDVRYTQDGTTPTTSIGHALVKDSFRTFRGFDQLENLKMVRATGSSAVRQVTYYYPV